MNRRRGFCLVLVIWTLILAGAVMFVLAGGSSVMLYQADKAYVRALERNLAASGLAWVRAKASAGTSELPAQEPVDLDVSAFGPSAVRLAVQVLEVQDGTVRVRVETSCAKRGRTFNAADDYTLALP